MSTRAAHRRERVAGRRRSVAASAVLACVVLDVWAVASGAAGQDTGSVPASSVSTMLSAGTRAGTLPPTAAVRSAMTDSREPGRGTDSTPSASATPRVVPRGDGRFTVLAVPAGATGPAPVSGRTVRYTVETEGGLGVDTREYATTVARVLNDQRGWETQDKVRFVNVTPAQVQQGDQVDIRVTLASPDTTDKLCAPLETRGRVSCFANGRAVLNAKRWLLGVEEAYGKDVATYRIYQVNHEVGHGIGHGHASCPGKNKPAPVMMQQTYGLDGCSPWPWPTAKPA